MKESVCLNCGKVFDNKYHNEQKYCSNACQLEYQRKHLLENWKAGKLSGCRGKTLKISNWVRNYMLEKSGYKCELCGQNKINPVTGVSPLQIHHIDGNPANNAESNLQVLCPNCHSLTETYMALNKSNGKSPRER